MSKDSQKASFEDLCLLIGSIGVIGVSIGYVLSPPAAAMPLAPVDLRAALEGAAFGATTMRAISAMGVPGDALFIVATFLIAIRVRGAGRGMEAAGWMLAGLGTVVFLLADSLVGLVLPQLAASNAPQAFLAAKVLFNLCFMMGTFVVGLGALLTAAPNLRSGIGVPAALAWPILVAGAGNLVSATAGLAGANVPQAMGLSVAADAVLYTLIAAAFLKGAGFGRPKGA
jgi:hypothetical protein